MATENEFQININPEIAGGVYSNLAIITHSTSEFIIDFASAMPGLPKPDVRSRIIMTPENAKRLMVALQDNVQKYEASNGPIALNNQMKKTFPIGGLNGNGAKS